MGEHKLRRATTVKLSQIHIYYHPTSDAVVLVRQGINAEDSTARDATAEFVHALLGWGMAQHETATTPVGKLWDVVAWWVKRKVFRKKAPVLRIGRRMVTDARGNLYNIIIEHCAGDKSEPGTENKDANA